MLISLELESFGPFQPCFTRFEGPTKPNNVKWTVRVIKRGFESTPSPRFTELCLCNRRGTPRCAFRHNSRSDTFVVGVRGHFILKKDTTSRRVVTECSVMLKQFIANANIDFSQTPANVRVETPRGTSAAVD